MSYVHFFQNLTGGKYQPFPYQEALAEDAWPEVMDIPTGLGKTAAVIGAWLWKRLQGDPETGRRLVYCLPMRVLVEQTEQAARSWCDAAVPFFEAHNEPAPIVYRLMGGYVEDDWVRQPEQPAILVGTQDMLLSRALNRGYAMRRANWPMHFALLGSDCLWVFDETQLMGVGVETSAQLEGFRKHFRTLGPTHSVWMSATVGEQQLSTVDHPEPQDGWVKQELGSADRDLALVQQRLGAKKLLHQAEPVLSKKSRGDYIDTLAGHIYQAHQQSGGLTLVFVNRVGRAVSLYKALRKRGAEHLAVVHSRFRPADRKQQEATLEQNGDRIVVTTQALEAGVDVSARTMFTEIAPWPSLVQRFGRCNRYGEQDSATISWIDIDEQSDESLALPYSPKALAEARRLLTGLEDGDAGPASLRKLDYQAPTPIRPVIRKRDLLELFDTTPDLYGHDIDVSRYIRDEQDTDVHIFWKEFPPDAQPPPDLRNPTNEEFCAVSLSAVRDFVERLGRWRQKLKQGSDKDRAFLCGATLWEWNSSEKRWLPIEQKTRIRPGQTLLLHPRAGGYDPLYGWTGQDKPKQPVPEILREQGEQDPGTAEDDALDGDPKTNIGRWVGLTSHLGHVGRDAQRLVERLEIEATWAEPIVTAARWHDLGKAHEVFQHRLLAPTKKHPEHKPPGDDIWAKSDHRLKLSKEEAKRDRPYFRHELASALAWLQSTKEGDPPQRDLIAYLIAAHHGQVRLSIRSAPGESIPDDERPFARGVWNGDPLPSVEVPETGLVGPVELDLSPMELGQGSWAERMLALRDHPDLGPFRLAVLECLVRVADWRASDKESRGEYDT